MAILSAVGGCAGMRAVPREGSLVPSRHPFEVDVPLPAGLELVDQSSEDWSGGSIRYLRHRYRGRADKHAVRRFYREQMPLVRWTAVGDGCVSGRITMRFEKGRESCTLTIEDEVVGLSRRVAVEMIIAPLTR